MDDSEKAWVDKFLHHLEFERRLSAHTCKHYRRDLDSLIAFCEQSGVDRWRAIDSDHVRSYSASSFRRGLSARSIQRRLSAARTFFRYLLREKHVKVNPVVSVSAPRSGKRLPENLDADRMARLLDIPGDDPIVNRDRAILELLYSSGLRLREKEADQGATSLPVAAAAVAPRRFNQQQLANLSMVQSAVECECPQHLAQLVSDLSAFEIYSAKCANRDDDDAALHRYLHETTAEARAMIEAALLRVAEAEGLSY